MKPTILVALVLGVAAISGCSSGEDNITALERIITEQMPAEVEEASKAKIKVDSVECKDGTAGKYDCVAKVSGTDPDGKPIDESVNIEGTCNDDQCRWETK